MDRDELLAHILWLLEADKDFPEFDGEKSDDGSAVLTIKDKEFMIMVVDITE